MPNSKKNNSILLLPVVSAVLVLIVSVFFYNIYIRDNINKLADNNLEQLVSTSAESFNITFESSINLLESSASLLPVWDFLRYINFSSDDYAYLARTFDYMVVINPYGYAVGSDTNIGNLANQGYFLQAMKGETVISKPLLFEFNGKEAIVISTPMIAHGETRGVLAGLIYLDTLHNMFSDPIQGVSANLIIDASGNIISNGIENSEFTPLSNAYNIIAKQGVKNTEAFEALKEDIIKKVSGQQIIDINGQLNRVIYEPVGIKDWAIMSIIPESIVQSTTNNIIIVTIAISIAITLVVAIFGYMINSAQRHTLEEIEKVAYTSQLTEISTLVKFKLDAQDFLLAHASKRFLLIKFDVENFRLVNESLGVAMGDEILKCMAKAIDYKSSYACIKAHIHADEFLVMLAYTEENVRSWHEDYSKRVLEMLGDKVHYNIRIVAGYYYFDTLSIDDISTAIERVNIAHHYAKETKSLLSVYSEEFLESAIKKKDIENNMEAALKNGEFIMVLQPELDLQTGKLFGAEALVRWQRECGLVRPDEFIPVFEQNGFILKLDMYMFEQACKYLQAWISEGRKPFAISVNFSRKHLYSTDFISSLLSICEQYNVATKYLGIEITETSMLSNEGDLISLMHQLKEKNFKVLMDDFGSGYSSLGLLKNIPLDVLKLDKSFFANIEQEERSISIVRSVIQLAKNLNIKTIAEGVETLETMKALKQMECDIVQGYYYAKPMLKEELKDFYDSDASKVNI